MTAHTSTERGGSRRSVAPWRRCGGPSRWLLVAVVSGAGLLAACGGGDPGSGPLRLAVDGRAVVEQADGEAIVVEGNRRVELGSRVEMVTGSATLEYPDGPTYELREGLGAVEHTTVVAHERPHLESGDLLVVGAAGDEVDIDGATVRLDGDGKIGRRLSLVAQVYEGRAEMTSAGRSVTVPALRQAAVPAARLVPAAPSPLVYDAADPWDRRYLAEAVALGDALVARARGFTAQLQPGEGRSAGFYRLLLPELESQPGFGPTLVHQTRPPGETLVGAAIAVAADDEPAAAHEFVDRWSDVFAFRDQGADWGLVALDQQVAQAALVDRLDAAIARAPLAEIAGGPAGEPAGPSGTSPPPPPPGDEPDGGPTTSPPPPTEPPPPPTSEPPPDPGDVDDTVGGLLDPLVDPEGNDGLLDPLLGEPDPSGDDGLLGNLLGAAAEATSSLVEGVSTAVA